MYRHHNLGKRRTALLAAAIYCLSRALAYLPSVRGGAIQEPILNAAAGRPWLMAAYVTAWAIAGIGCLYYLPGGRLLRPLSLVVGLMAAWGMAWAIGALEYPGHAYWQTALTYWCPAVMTVALVSLTPKLETADE